MIEIVMMKWKGNLKGFNEIVNDAFFEIESFINDRIDREDQCLDQH